MRSASALISASRDQASSFLGYTRSRQSLLVLCIRVQSGLQNIGVQEKNHSGTQKLNISPEARPDVGFTEVLKRT
jgi:hypothetical protein